MLQPISFTDPPYSPDEPDGLPSTCPCCGTALGDWQWEELVYGRQDRELVWFIECLECGSIQTLGG